LTVGVCHWLFQLKCQYFK